MERVITKVVLLKEVCNDMCHNWYFGCYGRIFSPDQKHYKQCSFVLVVDSEDISDYFDGKEIVTQKNVREYVKFVALETMYSNVTDYNNLREFYNWCNETIEKYNGTNRW